MQLAERRAGMAHDPGFSRLGQRGQLPQVTRAAQKASARLGDRGRGAACLRGPINK